ncbi:hypothetical protein QJS10_CPB17g02225 [Acorus calamus]|uniref:Uncharacterized protein n=1 Tax=Acorus calamus TaxID=4465 RepID=A0AAV9CSV5_ACOCL|nr:hypothetical protein QJS10_CPB17g02225 [Acorus calamus]
MVANDKCLRRCPIVFAVSTPSPPSPMISFLASLTPPSTLTTRPPLHTTMRINTTFIGIFLEKHETLIAEEVVRKVLHVSMLVGERVRFGEFA